MKDYIIRKKTGKVTKYYDKRGNILSKKKAESYLNTYIPPGYDNVKINKRRGKIRAIGYDDKNRPQYIYDKNYTSKRSCLKFKDLIEFGKNYKTIFDKIQKDLYTTSETKDKQIATVLMLIIECDFRVGNDKYTRDNKSYGATTLEKRHVKSKSGKIYIDFIGKKGVKNKGIKYIVVQNQEPQYLYEITDNETKGKKVGVRTKSETKGSGKIKYKYQLD